MRFVRYTRRVAGIVFALAIFSAAFSTAAAAAALASGPVAIIVHKGNPVDAIAERSLRKIYSNNILRWPNGLSITMYDLTVNDPLRIKFSDRILGRPSYRVAEDWAHKRITNQAKNPPHTVKSQSYIIRKVSEDRSAIGYVLLDAVKDNPHVKVIKTIK